MKIQIQRRIDGRPSRSKVGDYYTRRRRLTVDVPSPCLLSLSLSLSLSSFFLRFVLSEFLRIRQRRSRLSRLPDTGRFNVIIRRACRRVRERRARTTRFWHVIKPDGVARTRPSEQMSGRSLGNVYAGWILYSRDIRRTRAARRPLCRASDSTFKQTPRK